MELLQLEETPVKEEANAEEVGIEWCMHGYLFTDKIGIQGTKSVSLADQLWFPWGLIAQVSAK
jgi:hypothetical protein